MDTYHILSKKDLETDERFKALSSSNPNLYQYLSGMSKEAAFPGIREDVFSFICNHCSDISDDHEYAYNITQFSCNAKMDPAWFEWLNEKRPEISDKIPIIDFCLIIAEAVEKDVPLAAFKQIYERHAADPLYIFEDLDHYMEESLSSNDVPVEDTDKEKRSKLEEQPVEEADVCKALSEDTSICKSEISNDVTETPSYNKEPEYAEMFSNLLTIMTDKHNDERFDIQGEVQSHISEISVLFSTIFRMWNSDKDEMERLEALYKLQQKILCSQQKKINEMKNTITKLQYQLNEAGKMDIKRDEIRKKIAEVQSLMSPDVELFGIGEL
jgi:hypothetical protein